jgi:hypothetical protein
MINNMSKTGRVYCIQHKEKYEISYIGSTVKTLNERFQKHKSDCKLYETGTRKYLSSIGKYFLEYGIECFDIFLLKEYQVCDKRHLLVLEQLYINTSKCVNKLNACALTKVFEKEFRKKYSEAYREEKKEKLKEYRLENKENNKEYRQANKEKLKEYQKKYKKEHKEEIKKHTSRQFECICGSTILISNKSTHNKSIKHKNYIDSNK